MMELPDHQSCQINRFCRQFLQLDPAPDYPEAALLRQADIQDQLFNQLFSESAGQQNAPPPRYRLRILKQLVSKIESSITDWEEHGVSDDLMTCLGELLAQPLPPESSVSVQQQRSYVTYYLSLLERNSSTSASLMSSTGAPATNQITLFESPSLISASGTTGLRTWEAALHLGQYLCAHPSLVKGRHVLEIGAGTGYLSILCARHLGAAHVLATDGSPEVVAALPDNYLINGLEPLRGGEHFAVDVTPDSKISTASLIWGRPISAVDGVELERRDLVLGADITYDRELVGELLDTLGQAGQRWPGVEVVIAATQRNEETFQTFLEGCRTRGFGVDDLEFDAPPRKDQTGPFYDATVRIRICRVITSLMMKRA